MAFRIITLLAITFAAALSMAGNANAQVRLENGVVKAWNGHSFQPFRRGTQSRYNMIPEHSNQIYGLGYTTLLDPIGYSRPQVKFGRYSSRAAALQHLQQQFTNQPIYGPRYLRAAARSGIRSTLSGYTGTITRPGYSKSDSRFRGSTSLGFNTR